MKGVRVPRPSALANNECVSESKNLRLQPFGESASEVILTKRIIVILYCVFLIINQEGALCPFSAFQRILSTPDFVPNTTQSTPYSLTFLT